MAVKIIYRDVAVGAAESATVSAPGTQDRTTPAQLPFGADVPPLASLEKNLWLLDGSFELQTDQLIPYRSSAMSDDSGKLEAPPLDISFSENCTSLGISFRFSPATGDFVSRLQITWYRGDTQLEQATFTPTGTFAFCAKTVTAYNRVVIKLLAASLPGRYARIEQIMFGIIREFGPDELRKVSIDNRVDLISDELDANSMDLTLESKDNIDFIFQTFQTLEAFDGDVLVGTYYVEQGLRMIAQLYEIECFDALGLLARQSYAAHIWLSDTPVQTILADVIGDKIPWELDPTLSSATLKGYIPDGTRLEALRQVLFALGAVTGTAGRTGIHIWKLQNAAPIVVSDTRCQPASLSMEPRITALRLTTHSWSTVSFGNETSVTVDGTTYYDTEAVVEIVNPEATSSDQENVVEFTDRTMVSPDIGADLAAQLFFAIQKSAWAGVLHGLDGELPGDPVTVPTLWGAEVSGRISRMQISLSANSVADVEVAIS